MEERSEDGVGGVSRLGCERWVRHQAESHEDRVPWRSRIKISRGVFYDSARQEPRTYARGAQEDPQSSNVSGTFNGRNPMIKVASSDPSSAKIGVFTCSVL